MSDSKLRMTILERISSKAGLSPKTIRNNITRLRHDYPSLPINAVAYLYARSLGVNVLSKLSKEEKQSLPHNEVEKPKVKIAKKITKPKPVMKTIISYQSEDYFVAGHIKEINKAYTEGCYTSVHILARKIIENLVREILSEKFPENTQENKALYFDIQQRRFKDFSILLKTLYDKRTEFEVNKIKAIERLYDKTKKFKDEANDTTHSWYHLIESKAEIDDLQLQSIIELIKTIKS